jgi:hypothetical protein
LEFNQILHLHRKKPEFINEFLRSSISPQVGIEEEVVYTIEDYMGFIAAIADGLNWEDDYENSIECVY